MAIGDFLDWMAESSRPNVLWYVKRLSGNDTLANGAHQAGPYVPKELLFRIFPDMNQPGAENPDVRFDLHVDSHGDRRRVRAVWYNNRNRGGTRNEARLTGFGGQASALLDPDSTGALTIFAFVPGTEGMVHACHAWVCRSAQEEEYAEDRLGPVEPGRLLIWSPSEGIAPDLFATRPAPRRSCRLSAAEMPPAWLRAFPSGVEIIRKAVELRPLMELGPDDRLIRRRECEYEVFLSVEEAVELPRIRRGFESIDGFVARAQSILQRRKARSGRSLELHALEIFEEEGLRAGRDFEHGVESEPGRRPDFLFPSQTSYRDPGFPDDDLRMLAVKTTCRDRWRQVCNEAGRIRTKHLLTLQEGVSEGQFREMQESGVALVVPAGLVTSYPAKIRPELITLGTFLSDAKSLWP